MNKIFVFGDSFSTSSRHNWSWINRLSEKYNLSNYSAAGLSCSKILDLFQSKFLFNEIEKSFVIFCLSDKSRDYMNIEDPEWDLKSKSIYRQSISKIYEILNDKNINHVIVWGFPSDYAEVNGWLNKKFVYVDKNTYKYFIEFSNQIKPALIYYSRQECKHIVNEKKLCEYFSNDRRPNHIANEEIHKKLADVVSKFINKEITGSVNLEA
jgi:hypothetical protein